MEISALLAPLPDGEGAGKDVRYDPLFDALQSEVEKLTSPVFCGIVDWEGVAELASEILAKKSKDLVVTSYLAVALLHTRKEEGFLPGLRLYHGILETFWDHLYPARNKMRGRLLSIEWWLEKTVKALQSEEVRLSPEQGKAGLEILTKIHALLTERLPDPPSLEPLRRVVAERQETALHGTEDAAVGPTSAVRESEATAPKLPPAQPAGRTPGPRMREGDEAEESQGELDLEGALQRVRRGALLRRREDPADAVSYRLLRSSLWSTVTALPPAAEGNTRIPAPDRQQTALLKELRERGDASALLDASEGRLPQHIFWLDLNRLSFEALGTLGAPYRGAQDAVLEETAHLVRRLPGVEDLRFSDGTPFAEPHTRQWLEESAAPVFAPPAPIIPSFPEAAEEGVSERGEALERARLLAGEGKLPEAVGLLHDRVQSCSSGRERLLCRIALVEFLMRAGDPRLPLPLLEQVLGEVDSHALDSYEPAVALGALKLAYALFHSQKEPAVQEKALAALFRIGRLDPAEMVRLQKG